MCSEECLLNKKVTSERNNKYVLRNRPKSEKFIDLGFKNLTIAMSATVAILLFAILIVVFAESTECIK